MNSRADKSLALRWATHAKEWRHPAQTTTWWKDAGGVDPTLLEYKASKDWWDLLQILDVTLFVTREYENFAMALSAPDGNPRLTFFPVPHPSGLAADPVQGRLYLASTRNPNQIIVFRPTRELLFRTDLKYPPRLDGGMIPSASYIYPGCLYMHDIALIGGRLHANAVGHNAVVRLHLDGTFTRVWWPKSISVNGQPRFERNYIQLNSIAAGPTLARSYFSSSSEKPGRRRPGHLNYVVDGRGVIFSGSTREPICRGLTRPHSARIRDGTIWVSNSGYGQVGYVEGDRFCPTHSLPGWTRGLAIYEEVLFVGTSRIIPKYSRYAPGLDGAKTRCGMHAICVRTGKTLASIEWPSGNQIFAIEGVPARLTPGFPFAAGRQRSAAVTALFYAFDPQEKE